MVVLDIRVLGSLAAIVDDRPRTLGGPMPRALLARLVIAAGDTVPTSVIIDDLWRGHPPRSATSTLQGYISTLRRVLEPQHAQSDPTILVRRGAGYALAVPDDAVAARRFERAVARATAQLAADDAAGARETIQAALDLWTGRAYADAEGWEFADIEAARLATVRTDALEQLQAARIDCGDHDSSSTALEAMVRADPLRERSWELLALAHYRAGRQGEALDALRRARAAIAEELGTDPSPALADMQTAILHHDPALRPRRSPRRRAPAAWARRAWPSRSPGSGRTPTARGSSSWRALPMPYPSPTPSAAQWV